MEKVCTIYLCDCKINKLRQSNVDFHINTFTDEYFHEKKLFLQLFIPNAHITFQLVLKETTFQLQTVAVMLKTIHFSACTISVLIIKLKKHVF